MLFESLLDRLAQGVLLVNKDYRIVVWNHWLEKASGLRRADVIGKKVANICPCFAELKFRRMLTTAIVDGQSRFCSGMLHQPFVFRRDINDQEIIRQNMQIEPFEHKDEVFALIQINDITVQYRRLSCLQDLIKKFETDYQSIDRLKRLEESLAEKALAAADKEIRLLKECLRTGDSAAGQLAGVVADIVSLTLKGEIGAINAVLSSIVQDIIDYIETEFSWLGKYVDLQHMANVWIYNNSDESICTRFQRFFEEVLSVVEKFSYNDIHGPAVKEVSKFILRNIDEELSLKKVASALYMNRTHMSEVFKAKTGISVGEYLINMKIERAKKILSSKEEKVAEVAERLGYKDVEYFSRLFKSRTGLFPSEYRSLNTVR